MYSYKEQLEELQLRRELEEKKRKEGKVKPPQYTPKQLEAIKNQKIKEQGIRSRLAELNSKIEDSVSMITAAARGNPLHLSLYYKDLLSPILQDLQSPLAAPKLCKLFTDLRHTVFPKHLESLGELVAYVTLRLARPQCDLEADWESENLNKAMVRAVSLIHQQTVPKKTEGEIEQQCFTVPAFSYTFPLLKYSLTSNHARNHEELIHEGLQIVTEHAKLRGNEENGTKDIYHPRYLPTRQMFILLVDVITSTTGRVQSQCEACLLEVAGCVSGQAGCAKATKEEIDVLLGALQSPTAVVRDAALRGLTIDVASLPTYETDYEYAIKVHKRIWIACFDQNEENRELAKQLWENANMDFPTSLSEELMSDVEHPVECVQAAAAAALAALLENDTDQVDGTLKDLIQLYKDRLKVRIGCEDPDFFLFITF